MARQLLGGHRLEREIRVSADFVVRLPYACDRAIRDSVRFVRRHVYRFLSFCFPIRSRVQFTEQ